MKLPLAGFVAVVLSGIIAAGSAAEGVSPWVPIGLSGSAALGLVVLFRKVQKDIIGEQDKRYEDLKRDLRGTQREALRAKKRAENAERLHAHCELSNRLLRRALVARGYVDDDTITSTEFHEPVMREPTDEELDIELGYADED
jgi:hypothetical protein